MFRSLILLVLFSAVVLNVAWCQTATSFRVVAPLNGDHVGIGPVTVRISRPPTVSAAMIKTVDSCGRTSIQAIANETSEVRIHALQPGPLSISAAGGNATGLSLLTDPITVVVNAPDMSAASVRANPPSLSFRNPGETAHLGVEFVYPDKVIALCALNGLGVTLAVADPTVASTQQDGTVIAQSPGKTTLDLTLGSVSLNVPVTVEAHVRGDLDGDGDVDGNDLRWLTAYVNRPVVTTNDARDLNKDGRVDVLDSNVLTSLCVRPNCAESVNEPVEPNGDPTASPLLFVPVAPCRVADTRNSGGPFGGPTIAAGSSRHFAISNSGCGIPPSAAAYSMNVTVVPQGLLGYLTVWPTGKPLPLASTLNSLDGRVKANAAIVPAGTSGSVSVFATNSTDVILDVNGYFVPAPDASALAFYPLPPCRVADTRSHAGALGGPALIAGQERSFDVRSAACNVPASAKAYSLNFTAVPNGPLGYITTWASGSPRPVVSTLNAPTAQVTANAAIVPAGTNGHVAVFTTSSTNLIVDINGYFAPPGTGGLSLYNVAPCRAVDTREPAGATSVNGLHTVNVAAGPCAVSTSAKAYVFNATVVPSGLLGYLSLWAQSQPQPVVSTLNALDGAVTSNMAIVPTVNGSIHSFSSNPTHYLLDVFGYFAP